MYEVLTFHLGNVSTVRFFFPPVVHRWTFPCCRPIWSPAPRALWKRAMNSGKVGEPLGGRDFFYRWSWFIYVDFDFARKQLVGVGFSISDGTMLKGPILYKNLSAAWIITSFMCTGEVDPAMPGSTGVTFTATDITGLILLVQDSSAGWSTPRLLCSRDLFQPQHLWRLLGWLLVIVDHRPTGTAVACCVRGFISKSCCWLSISCWLSVSCTGNDTMKIGSCIICWGLNSHCFPVVWMVINLKVGGYIYPL